MHILEFIDRRKLALDKNKYLRAQIGKEQEVCNFIMSRISDKYEVFHYIGKKEEGNFCVNFYILAKNSITTLSRFTINMGDVFGIERGILKSYGFIRRYKLFSSIIYEEVDLERFLKWK